MHTAKIEIRECVKLSLTRSQNQWKIINRRAQKEVAVAYRRWSFTRGSNCEALTRKKFGVLDWWSLIGGDSLRGVAAHGDSTVYGFKIPSYKEINGQLDNPEACSSCSDRRNGPKRSD